MKKFQAIMVACLIAVIAIPCAIAQEAKTAPQQLLVGAAVRDLTPKSEWLPLFGVAKTKMVGVIDPIHVRVIALSNGKTPSLVVTFEMSGVPPAETFLTALSKHTGVPIDAIFYSATHCHSAPNTTIDPKVPSTELYSKFVYDQMIDAADKAIASMQPATVGIGYAESYINVNRQGTFTKPDGTIYGTQGYNPTGPSDKTLAVIRFDDKNGKPIAFIVNYAVHNTVMYANHFNKDGVGISADLGGYVSTCIENKFGGAVATWLPGASGNQNPILSNEHFTPSPTTGEQEITFFPYAAVELLKFYGKVQFADVLTALSRIKTVTSDAKVSYAYGGSTIPNYTDGGKDFGLNLKLLRIGDIALVGNPGEMFNSIGVYMKNHSLLKNTLIVNNCRTYTEQYTQFTTYIPDDDAMINNGFHGNPKLYKVGSVNDGFTALMNKLIASTK
jgi:neutral ceramidase